jgi:serine/threonine-protein kinase
MVVPVELLERGEPMMLDRYQLIGEIASGGMATVYLARLAGVGGFSRLVAIKRLHPHLAREREFVEMFLDEARLAAGIHHQNVVGIQEIGTSDDGYYLVMDYVEGVTLATLLADLSTARKRVATPIALRIVNDTLCGLQAAHELKDEVTGAPLAVVHRDCTPQNILVGMDGSSRLTDFGIARAASRIGVTRDGSMKGKLAYMAPEQTKGDALDSRADLFSVGVVLWEALSGRRLFRGTTEAETLRRLLVEPIPPLADIAEVHPALSQACARALAREPEDRFGSAIEMIEALESAAREWGTAAGEGEPVAPIRSVGALMRELYEEGANEQREAVRRWVQAAPAASSSERELTRLAPSACPSLEALPIPRASVPTTIGMPRTSVDDDPTALYARSGVSPLVRTDGGVHPRVEPSTSAGGQPIPLKASAPQPERTPAPTSQLRPRSVAPPSGLARHARWLGLVLAAVAVVGVAVMLGRPRPGPMQGSQLEEDGVARGADGRAPDGLNRRDGVGVDPVPDLTPSTAPEGADGEFEREVASPKPSPLPSTGLAPGRLTLLGTPRGSGGKPVRAPNGATTNKPSATPPAAPSPPASPVPAGHDDLANPYR